MEDDGDEEDDDVDEETDNLRAGLPRNISDETQQVNGICLNAFKLADQAPKLNSRPLYSLRSLPCYRTLCSTNRLSQWK